MGRQEIRVCGFDVGDNEEKQDGKVQGHRQQVTRWLLNVGQYKILIKRRMLYCNCPKLCRRRQQGLHQCI